MKVVLIDKNPLTQFRIGHNYPIFTHLAGLAADIKLQNPDWVFISRKNGMEQVKSAIKDTKSVYFYGDYRNPLPEHALQFSHMCNMTLTTWRCPEVWKTLKNPHVGKMGTNPKFFGPTGEKPTYDVAFGGSNFGGKPRMKVLKFLKRNFNTLIVGNGWPDKWKPIKRTNLINMNKVLNRAKITVGAFNRTDMVEKGISYYTSNRLYQNMAVGRPHVTPYSPGVEQWFKKGYLCYNNLDHLGYLIEDLLEMSQEKRDKIGEVQRNEIINHHTHEHSWKYMEKVIVGNL